MQNWTKGLNEEQREAVEHAQGPLLILAGAGSGKTTVLVARTGYILENQAIEADEICVLTFTTKAASELKERVRARVGPNAGDLWTGTFHSFGLAILRKYHRLVGLPKNFGVIDQADSHGIVKDLLVNVRNATKDAFKIEKLAAIINDWRQTGSTSSINAEDEYQEMATVLLPKYLKRLETLGVVDFEGLLIQPLELFKKHPHTLQEMQIRFRHVMVDEFQDTNRAQFQLVQCLSAQHENIAVVGDDDQSIYGWRGACVSNILDFPKNYKKCKVIRLEHNYRSTPAILKVANAVIANNATRYGKILRPSAQAQNGERPEVFVYETDDLEADEISSQVQYFINQGFKHSDIAVLYRSNGQGGLIEAQLRRNQIPYSITGGTGIFDRRESKDVLAFLRCALSPNEVCVRRILNVPSRGIGDVTVERIAEFAGIQGLKFHQSVRQWKTAGISDSIGAHIDQFLHANDALPQVILNNQSTGTYGDRLVRWMFELGYRNYLAQTTKDANSLAQKWLIVEIVGRILDSYMAKAEPNRKSLNRFLDAMELRDTVDMNPEKAQVSAVQLLTLHACKGLEFPVVIFVGCEEDLIPHRTLGQDVAEERRLFYVGLTRAKQKLVLTRAVSRKRFGKWMPTAPSRFLLEIPPDLLTHYPNGGRPLAETDRKIMLSNLLAKLEKKADTSAH